VRIPLAADDSKFSYACEQSSFVVDEKRVVRKRVLISARRGSTLPRLICIRQERTYRHLELRTSPRDCKPPNLDASQSASYAFATGFEQLMLRSCRSPLRRNPRIADGLRNIATSQPLGRPGFTRCSRLSSKTHQSPFHDFDVNRLSLIEESLTSVLGNFSRRAISGSVAPTPISKMPHTPSDQGKAMV